MRKNRLIRIGKWFAGIVGGLFLLITLLLWLFKDDIINMVIKEANAYLSAEVNVAEVDLVFWETFPDLSVDFKNVFIKDACDGSNNLDTLLYSDLIRLRFNPMDIWRENYTLKKLEVGKGTLQLKIDSLGENNYDIIRDSKSEGTEEFELNLKQVEFTNFRLTYTNAATDQIYSTSIHHMTLNGALSSRKFTTDATTHLRVVEARSGKIKLIQNQEAILDLRLNVDLDSGKYIIPTSTVYISNLPFNFDCSVDSASYALNLSGKNISIEDAANNLALDETEEVKKFSGSGKVLFNLSITGGMSSTEPAKINCDFGVSEATLTDPSSNITLRKIVIEGEYSNTLGPKKEFLALRKVYFDTRGGPFKGKLKITEFDEPLIRGEANGFLNLSVIHRLFRLKKFKELSGKANVSARFSIKAKPTLSNEFEYELQKCSGEFLPHEMNIQLDDDRRVYRNINGKIYLRDDKIGLDDITCNLGKSDFRINGAFVKLVEYLSGRHPLETSIEMESDFIDVSDLGSSTVEDKIDLPREFMLPNDINGKVYLDVKKLSYRKHLFFDIMGNMVIGKRLLTFDRINLKNAGAELKGDLRIEERSPEIFHVTTNAATRNIDMQKLFLEWNNFEQTVIMSDNISGKAQASVRLSAPFDLRNGILYSGIVAEAGLKLENGKLKGVDAFKEITSSLKESSVRLALGKENINAFEKKLLNLDFETLENSIIIRDGMIIIPEMSVHSSALDIELSGKHTFENKIDYRFGFRFRDLKQKKESEFGEILDDGTGFKVFMRMFGDLDDPNIEWDNNARKEEAKENREQEKQNAKAILKTEFGLFKNDTTVNEYIPDKRPKEQLIIHFDPENAVDTIMEENIPKRDTKLRKFIKKLEKEKEAEKKVEFEIDN